MFTLCFANDQLVMTEDEDLVHMVRKVKETYDEEVGLQVWENLSILY